MKTTVELDVDQYEQLEDYCDVTGETMESAVRQALADWIPVVAETRMEAKNRDAVIHRPERRSA